MLSFFLGVEAHHNNSNLTVNVHEFGQFIVEVNGNTYPAYNGTVSLDGIPAGSYAIRILKRPQARRGYHHSHQRPRVVAQQRMRIQPFQAVIVDYDRFGMDVNRRGTGNRYGHGNACGANVGYTDVAFGMNEATFRRLTRSVNASAFDQSKVRMAKTAIREQGSISTDQMIVLMRELSFDSYKVDLAKFGYAFAADPENYFFVADELTFDSNRNRLLSFMDNAY